jgi:hypothetical protein
MKRVHEELLPGTPASFFCKASRRPSPSIWRGTYAGTDGAARCAAIPQPVEQAWATALAKTISPVRSRGENWRHDRAIRLRMDGRADHSAHPQRQERPKDRFCEQIVGGSDKRGQRPSADVNTAMAWWRIFPITGLRYWPDLI